MQEKPFTNWQELADFLQLPEELRAQLLRKSTFPLLFPYRLAQKVKKGTLDDPILRQFLPLQEEHSLASSAFSPNPLEENRFQKSSRFLQKYRGRALLLCSSACAMHCRYCFRRSFPYENSSSQFEEELSLIRQDPSLQEILLSGGDPLSLSNRQLEKLLTDLDGIEHVKRVRFHTRFLIGNPDRIDEAFLSLLAKRRVQIYFVIHCNHPRELDEEIFSACKALQKLGIPLLHQAVLLKGVNDSEPVLKELFESLANRGIIPYYLHQLDRVEGSLHFEVSEEKGRALLSSLRAQLSGYAFPRYVKEVPGQTSKSLLF